MTTFVMTAVALAAAAAAAMPQDHPATCPMHAAHTQQAAAPAPDDPHAAHAGMNARGTAAMGFDQSRATHHFTLLTTGGIIEIAANSPDDDEVRQQVVAHLRDISTRFGAGDFGIPEATHGVMPPGASAMAAARAVIAYRFEPLAAGGRLHITTSDPQALQAVHEFLRYQITEHRTGDPLTIAR